MLREEDSSYSCIALSSHRKNTNINPKDKNLHDFICILVWSSWGSEPTFMTCRKQEVIDISKCSRKLAVLVGTEEFLENLLTRITGRYALLLSMWKKKNRIATPDAQIGCYYRMDFEVILNKAPSRFHTLDNLKVAAQFISNNSSFWSQLH